MHCVVCFVATVQVLSVVLQARHAPGKVIVLLGSCDRLLYVKLSSDNGVIDVCLTSLAGKHW